jgi:hypothetical protein
LSHFDSEHKDNYVHPTTNEGNKAVVSDVLLSIPMVTIVEPGNAPANDSDAIEFQGAWCVSISTAEATLAFLTDKPAVERESDWNWNPLKTKLQMTSVVLLML